MFQLMVLMLTVLPQNLVQLILYSTIALPGITLMMVGIHMIKKETIQLLLNINIQLVGIMVMSMSSLANMIMIMVLL
jgi:hypothetical protein